MSVDEAYADLGLEVSSRHDDAKVRKAYFKLAQKYHPDKNPDGRVSLNFFSILILCGDYMILDNLY